MDISEEFNAWVAEMTKPDIMLPKDQRLDVSGIDGIRPMGIGMKS